MKRPKGTPKTTLETWLSESAELLQECGIPPELGRPGTSNPTAEVSPAAGFLAISAAFLDETDALRSSWMVAAETAPPILDDFGMQTVHSNLLS